MIHNIINNITKSLFFIIALFLKYLFLINSSNTTNTNGFILINNQCYNCNNNGQLKIPSTSLANKKSFIQYSPSPFYCKIKRSTSIDSSGSNDIINTSHDKEDNYEGNKEERDTEIKIEASNINNNRNINSDNDITPKTKRKYTRRKKKEVATNIDNDNKNNNDNDINNNDSSINETILSTKVTKTKRKSSSESSKSNVISKSSSNNSKSSKSNSSINSNSKNSNDSNNNENKLDAELILKIAKQLLDQDQERREEEENEKKRIQEEEQQRRIISNSNKKKLKSVAELMDTINIKLSQKQQQSSSIFVDDPFLSNSEDRSIAITSQMMDNVSYNKLLEFNAKNNNFGIDSTATATTTTTTNTIERDYNDNDNQEYNNDNKLSSSSLFYHVIVIFGKPLIQDQITLEYAYRIRTLVQLLKDSHYYDNNNNNNNTTSSSSINNSFLRPNLITFAPTQSSSKSSSSSSSSSSNDNIIGDGTAGYTFFRQLASIYNISLDDNTMHYHILNSSSSMLQKGQNKNSKELNEVSSIKQILNIVESNYLPNWLLLQKQQNNYDIKNKLRIHFTFISSKHHLCNMNDIHQRSPRYGLFTPILDLERLYNKPKNNYNQFYSGATAATSSTTTAAQQQVDNDNLNNIFQGITLDSSWSYSYSTYPYTSSSSSNIIIHNNKNDNDNNINDYDATKITIIDFLSKCYNLGQELTPILVNMRGVVDKTEFFQRDNFLVLSTIRRLLVKHIEEIYNIQQQQRTLPNYNNNYGFLDSLNTYASETLTLKHNNKNDIIIVDVMECLESALLLLGRCTDIVRPAGLLVTYTDNNSWIKALKDLEQCMNLIYSICDPDRPLVRKDWINLLLLDDSTYDDDSTTNNIDDDDNDYDIVKMFEPITIREQDDDDDYVDTFDIDEGDDNEFANIN